MHKTIEEWKKERKYHLSPRLANQALWDLLWEDLPGIFEYIDHLEENNRELADMAGLHGDAGLVDGKIALLQERIAELEKTIARQNARDPELLEKVKDYINAEHWLSVDMDDGSGRDGVYIEIGFLRDLINRIEAAEKTAIEWSELVAREVWPEWLAKTREAQDD